MLKVVNFFIVAFPKYREKLLAIYTPSFARSRTNGPPNTTITKDFAPRLLALFNKKNPNSVSCLVRAALYHAFHIQSGHRNFTELF